MYLLSSTSITRLLLSIIFGEVVPAPGLHNHGLQKSSLRFAAAKKADPVRGPRKSRAFTGGRTLCRTLPAEYPPLSFHGKAGATESLCADETEVRRARDSKSDLVRARAKTPAIGGGEACMEGYC